MILVDTSVLIHFFKGVDSESSRKFSIVLQRGIPFGINSLIFQEVLQGAKSEKEYLILRKYLGACRSTPHNEDGREITLYRTRQDQRSWSVQRFLYPRKWVFEEYSDRLLVAR